MAGNSEAWKRYRKDNVKPVGFNLNRNTDADVIERRVPEAPNS